MAFSGMIDHCRRAAAIFVVTSCLSAAFFASGAEYFGTLVGEIPTLAHDVRGTVYVVDEDTIFIKEFYYDGAGPDAFFWVGTGSKPNSDGTIVPYPANADPKNPPILRRANGQNILLRLPDGVKVFNIDYLSVWCRLYAHNFGHVLFRREMPIPKPVSLDGFATRRNGVRSATVVVQDDRTLQVSDFSYDGRARDAYFFAGKGQTPSLRGEYVELPDETGMFTPLREYRSEDIKLVLPKGRSITEFNWVSVYSRAEDEDLGHVTLPRQLLVPPSLNGSDMLSPGAGGSNGGGQKDDLINYSNCIEPLPGLLQVRWKLAKDRRSAIIQLMGKIETGGGANSQYMAFGLSGVQGRAQMVGGDVVVGYYNPSGDSLELDDYFMSAKSQCDGQQGVCPDKRVDGKDDTQILFGEMRDGVTVITYQRPTAAGDAQIDAALPVDSDASVIAAIGQISSDFMARYHAKKRTTSNIRINFAREGQNTCGAAFLQESLLAGGGGAGGLHPGQHPGAGPHEHDHQRTSERPGKSLTPWKSNVIMGSQTMEVKIGPTGGSSRGYTAITGLPSWGIAWWINGLLIPEIYVEKGQTYRFVVEGGDSDSNPAESHPFYITSSAEGGFGQKRDWERQSERIFAGVQTAPNGSVVPTARGRLCKYMQDAADPREPEEFETFEEFRKSLKVACTPGTAGELLWTVDENTPPLVYYQCFIHKSMGWKIHVKDRGWIAEHRDGSGASALSTVVSRIVTLTLAAVSVSLLFF